MSTSDLTTPDHRSIFIAAHKAFPVPKDDGYVPVHAGKATATVDLGFVGDDTGENISVLNPFFCELTILFWIWKNVSCEQIGLVHYRRYFGGLYNFSQIGGKDVAAASDFVELDKSFDVVLPIPDLLTYGSSGVGQSVEQQYVQTAQGIDLIYLRKTVLFLYPDYIDAYDFVMRNNRLSSFNMFVGKKSVLDTYCDWLFKILFFMEKKIPYRSYEPAKGRVFGFLAERLFNVWIAHNWNCLNVAYRPTVFIDS